MLLSCVEEEACEDLLFVDVWINGIEMRALLDTMATNHFVARVVECLGLLMTKDSSRVKPMNFEDQMVHKVVDSLLKIGDWEKECNFMVIPLDDFDLILGIEFLVNSKATMMPYLYGLNIIDEGCPCFVIVVKVGRGKRDMVL